MRAPPTRIHSHNNTETQWPPLAHAWLPGSMDIRCCSAAAVVGGVHVRALPAGGRTLRLVHRLPGMCGQVPLYLSMRACPPVDCAGAVKKTDASTTTALSHRVVVSVTCAVHSWAGRLPHSLSPLPAAAGEGLASAHIHTHIACLLHSTSQLLTCVAALFNMRRCSRSIAAAPQTAPSSTTTTRSSSSFSSWCRWRGGSRSRCLTGRVSIFIANPTATTRSSRWR